MQCTISPTGRLLPPDSLADQLARMQRVPGVKRSSLGTSQAESDPQRCAEVSPALANADFSVLERRVLAHMGDAAAYLK